MDSSDNSDICEEPMKALKIYILFSIIVLLVTGNPGYSDGGCEGENVPLSASEKNYAAAVLNKIKAVLPKMTGYYPTFQESPAEDYFMDCDKKKYVKDSEVYATYATQVTAENMGGIEECSKLMENAGPGDADQLKAALAFQECMKGSGVGTGSIKVLINQGGVFGGSGDQGSINLSLYKSMAIAGADNAFQDANGVIYICLGNWTVKQPPEWDHRALVAQIPVNRINAVVNMIIIVEASNDKIRKDILDQINIKSLKALITK